MKHKVWVEEVEGEGGMMSPHPDFGDLGISHLAPIDAHRMRVWYAYCDCEWSSAPHLDEDVAAAEAADHLIETARPGA